MTPSANDLYRAYFVAVVEGAEMVTVVRLFREFLDAAYRETDEREARNG